MNLTRSNLNILYPKRGKENYSRIGAQNLLRSDLSRNQGMRLDDFVSPNLTNNINTDSSSNLMVINDIYHPPR